MLSQALTLATTLLALAAALCFFWRLLRGPDIVDPIMALDTLSIIAIALIVGYGIRTDNPAYFEMALLIALLGFVATGVALSKHLLRGDIIE